MTENDSGDNSRMGSGAEWGQVWERKELGLRAGLNPGVHEFQGSAVSFLFSEPGENSIQRQG